jgi:hypothetical protein
MGVSSGYISWKTSYEITPIKLQGGIAASTGNGLPIVALTNPGNQSDPVSANGAGSTLDGFNFHYTVLAGGTLLNFKPGTYPYANQSIAANALIADATNISLLMYCPATQDWPFSIRQTTITSLVASLQPHASLGGYYDVATAAYIFTGCLLTTLRDVSGADNHQFQYAWQWDFYRPLISLAAAQQAQNGLMQTLTNRTVTTGTPGWNSGSQVQNPTQALTQSLVPGPGSAGSG